MYSMLLIVPFDIQEMMSKIRATKIPLNGMKCNLNSFETFHIKNALTEAIITIHIN